MARDGSTNVLRVLHCPTLPALMWNGLSTSRANVLITVF
jgi:hypothetical protein